MPTQEHAQAPASRLRSAVAVSVRHDPSTLARRQSNLRRRDAGRLSGSTSSPYRKLHVDRPAATRNGSRRLTPPSSPPTAGPSTKAAPQTAPTSPNRLARLAGLVMSAM